MHAKALMLTLVAACGATAGPSATAVSPAEQPNAKPPDQPLVDQHWCCQSVDHKAKTGDGCTAISGSLETINACSNVLYCPDYWTKEDGVVTCE